MDPAPSRLNILDTGRSRISNLHTSSEGKLRAEYLDSTVGQLAASSYPAVVDSALGGSLKAP